VGAVDRPGTGAGPVRPRGWVWTTRLAGSTQVAQRHSARRPSRSWRRLSSAPRRPYLLDDRRRHLRGL